MKVLNFGSLNIDYVYGVDHIVAPGETISSRSLDVFPGGKGLNQSVALAKAGADVYHAGLVGNDGLFLKEYCEKQGVKTRYIGESPVRTGNAIIQVSGQGQNSIILFPGSNRELTKELIDEVLGQFAAGDLLVLQNEVNLLPYLIDSAKQKGMVIALNPSPYDEALAECDMTKISTFLFNEVEGEQMTGQSDPDQIIARMDEMYPQSRVVLTLGDQGSMYKDESGVFRQPIVTVKAVDTTAAGDTFTGFFLSTLMKGQSGAEALRIAAHASALAVSREGASVSIPTITEVVEFIENK